MGGKLKQFEGRSYLTLESFRRNGQGVKTPVWFVQDGTTLLVWTFAGSGKIKRIHRDGSVRITPSDAAGNPLGEWVHAFARADDSAEAVQYVETLMRKKYGFQFNLFRSLGKLQKSKNVIVKVDVRETEDRN